MRCGNGGWRLRKANRKRDGINGTEFLGRSEFFCKTLLIAAMLLNVRMSFMCFFTGVLALMVN